MVQLLQPALMLVSIPFYHTFAMFPFAIHAASARPSDSKSAYFLMKITVVSDLSHLATDPTALTQQARLLGLSDKNSALLISAPDKWLFYSCNGAKTEDCTRLSTTWRDHIPFSNQQRSAQLPSYGLISQMIRRFSKRIV